jgi:phosphohistidine phosphatase
VQVYLVRHAEAITETLALRDPHRHLTPRGRAQARALGARLRGPDGTDRRAPTHVWSSPLVRAVQTAELVIASLQIDAAVEVVPALAPDGVAREVVAALGALPGDAVVVVVGHEPALSAIGAVVVGDPAFPALDKACAARLDDGALRWRLAWDAEAPIRAGA